MAPELLPGASAITMPAANAVFTIASQWDSNTPLLICKTDANGDAAVPLEHTIADNNQHWYAPRFQSLNIIF